MKSVLVLAAVLGVSFLEHTRRGTFLWLLYDVACSRPGRVERSSGAPTEPRRLTPRVHGWGYALSRHAAARRLGLV